MNVEPTIDLVLHGPEDNHHTSWPLGNVYSCRATPEAIDGVITKHLRVSTADAWLFWDNSLEVPSTGDLTKMLAGPAEVWHAGLRLGAGGLPGLIDFVNPTWMLNRDPDVGVEATSWRISLRACLVRTRVLRELGGPLPMFKTLEGAALEMGHRYIAQGALTRHIPSLIKVAVGAVQGTRSRRLPLDDELRFVYYRFGRRWSAWVITRAVLSGYEKPLQAARTWRSVTRSVRPQEPEPLSPGSRPAWADSMTLCERVSVLIPTLDRYPYLRTLLDQLRTQTIRPYEIIVVDQTPVEHRDTSIEHDFADLPLRMIYMDRAGQCSSRNLGLLATHGDMVLFLDDDDEVPSTIIEQHLNVLSRPEIDVSSGVAEEIGAGPLPANFRYGRVSDVFPTNNTMVRKAALEKSGLFDLAYDHGQRADGDLGMRLYISGALMLLDPHILVLHHHAPSGGLRAHKARVITYASSRQSLKHRHLPSATEVYLAMRYFTPRQMREMLWLRVLGTFSVQGRRLKKVIKTVIGVCYLPDTLQQVVKRRHEAEKMLAMYPQIPSLSSANSDEAIA